MTPYTTLWYRPCMIGDATWESIRNDVIVLLREIQCGGATSITLRGAEGSGVPVISPDAIIFNGDAVRGSAQDPFTFVRIIPATPVQRRRGTARVVGRCTTAGNAYDVAVSAVLLVIKYHMGDLVRVESTGATDLLKSTWPRAAQLIGEILGITGDVVSPDGVEVEWVGMD